MGKKKAKNIIEALLIVSEAGLSMENFREAIPACDEKDIREGLDALKEEYSSEERSFNIAEIAGKYRIVTKPEYLEWINNLYKKDIDRITGPSLEVMAIVAYKQPVTRAEVEAIRGVNSGGVLKALLDKELVRVTGRKEVIGRPLMYGTTNKFLEIFGLKSLEDLPVLRDFTEEELEYGKRNEQPLIDEIEEKVEVVEVADVAQERSNEAELPDDTEQQVSSEEAVEAPEEDPNERNDYETEKT